MQKNIDMLKAEAKNINIGTGYKTTSIQAHILSHRKYLINSQTYF